MILVTGATGTVGRLVTARLLEAGVPCRAMARTPAIARPTLGGVSVVHGNFDDRVSLEGALEGVSVVFLLSAPGPTIPRHDRAMIEAAVAAGVKRVVKLSGASVATRTKLGAWHQPGESMLRESTLGFTILRPSSFATNALRWAPAIRAGMRVPVSTGDGRQSVVDPRDIADVAVRALLSAEHDGKTYTLTGSELLSASEQLAILSRFLERKVKAFDVSIEEMRRQMITMGASEAKADALAETFRHIREGHFSEVSGDVEEVLRRKPRSFAQWARDHLAAFR